MKIMKFAIPGLLILLLANAGCGREKTFDITGQWSFYSGSQELYLLSFSGTLEEGTVAGAQNQPGAGNYSVSWKDVAFDFTSTAVGGSSFSFSGSFDEEYQMSGTMKIVAPYPPFEWTVEVVGLKY
jgi:hypothetical protein